MWLISFNQWLGSQKNIRMSIVLHFRTTAIKVVYDVLKPSFCTLYIYIYAQFWQEYSCKLGKIATTAMYTCSSAGSAAQDTCNVISMPRKSIWLQHVTTAPLHFPCLLALSFHSLAFFHSFAFFILGIKLGLAWSFNLSFHSWGFLSFGFKVQHLQIDTCIWHFSLRMGWLIWFDTLALLSSTGSWHSFCHTGRR